MKNVIKHNLLLNIVRTPENLTNISTSEWDTLVQEAYSSNLIGKLACMIETLSFWEYVPIECEWHFKSALTYFESITFDIHTEAVALKAALKPLGVTPVLLKGAAYIERGDIAGKGRYFSDLDIYVPLAKLDEIENMLKWQGWVSKSLDDYDQKFYREWMHEIPPMFHRDRGTPIDVHHNLLPLTSRVRLNADLLEIDKTGGKEGLWSLSVADRFLHSAAHLLLDGEFDNGFRDMTDLYMLLDEHIESEEDYLHLIERADHLGLGRVLFYAVRYIQKLFQYEIPMSIEASIQVYAPPKPLLWFMDYLFILVLLPISKDTQGPQKSIAEWCLFVRSHWLKMPVHILIPHLFHKAVITPLEQRKKNQ